MKPVPTLALLVAALAVSCTNAVELPPASNDVVAVDGVADGTVPDKEVEPSGPVMVSLTPGLELTRSELLGEAVTFIADLGSGRRVLGTSTQLWLYEANTLRAELEVGEAVVAASYVDGVWLFGTTTHVLAWDGESLSPSPLGDAVGGRTPRALHAADGTLWLVMDDSIWHWQSGEVVELTVEGVSTAAATTTWGATFDNAAALWVAADPHIYGLRRTSGGNWDAVVERDDLEVLEMASDASGALWVLGAAGDLHRRQPDGSWEALDVGSAVQAVRAHPESSAAWFVTIAGSVIRHQEGVWLSAPWTELSKPVASSDGGVYVTTGATTEQLIPLGFAALANMPTGEIRQPVTATVVVGDPSRVAAITVTVDGTLVVPVSESPPYEFVLDPLQLSEGSHVVEVTIAYTDGSEPTTLSAAVEVGPPLSWARDIQPIWQNDCTPCHHPDTSSHPLHTAQLWRDEITEIIYNVETGIMPLDPEPELTSIQVALVKAWLAAGMPD